jgi:hypothetical protein
MPKQKTKARHKPKTAPKKMPTMKKQTTVKVGNISNVSGRIYVAGGDIETNDTTKGLSAEEIKQLFDQLYTVIEANKKVSPTKKEDLKAEVQEIQSTVSEAAQKNEKMDESFLSRRFRNIARMAPDILDVVVATLANPLAGLGVAVKKIAEKAKEEAKG